ncbi:MAG: ATP F0F1 synthase subunit B [Rubrimonas sp.]|uniref:F0F1 ATP synthase subunit B family protein n=1 Tax=Rubrimonas sp. TaxID=2036015 RepID=UPI002FDEDC73
MAILYDTYLVVALAFLGFFLVLWRYGVHNMIFKSLDARADRIRFELEEATRLREEAQSLLASYERKQRDVEETAAAIVARAKEDAQIAAEEARKALAVSIERRVKSAKDQIAAAETAAVRAVKDRAVDVASAAAADVIAASMTDAAANARVDAAIAEIGRKLH